MYKMPIDCTTVGMILFCLSKWNHKVTPSIMPGSTSVLPPFVQEEEKKIGITGNAGFKPGPPVWQENTFSMML